MYFTEGLHCNSCYIHFTYFCTVIPKQGSTDTEMGKTNYIQTDALTAILAVLLTLKLEQKEHIELLAKVCTLSNPLDYSQLFNEQNTAARLCISIPTIYRLRKNKKIHYHKIGFNIRYSLGNIVEFEESCRI
mgnify:CR=1 FL=1